MLAKFAVLASGNGSNLQALIDNIHNMKKGQIVLVLSDKPEAYALQRAKIAGINYKAISSKDYDNTAELNKAMLNELMKYNPDFIVLAGYMRILSPDWIKAYSRRIINIHPSLIPKHCGKGFYGIKVAESVIASGDKQTGITVHYVDEGTDTGPIIKQVICDVEPNESPENLQKRLLPVEHKTLSEVVLKLCKEYEK